MQRRGAGWTARGAAMSSAHTSSPRASSGRADWGHVALGSALLCAAAAAVVAWTNDRRTTEALAARIAADASAARAAHRALVRARAAGLAAASDAVLAADSPLAVLLATRALDLDDTPETEAALRRALRAHVEREVHEIGDEVWFTAYTDGGHAFFCATDGRAQLFRGPGERVVFEMPPGYRETVECVAVRPERAEHPAEIALGMGDGFVVRRSEARSILSSPAPRARWNVTWPVATDSRRAHSAAVTALAFSPDGARLASGDGEGAALLWTGDVPVTLTAHADAVAAIAFSPDGERVLTASLDGTARVSSAGGREVAVLRGHEGGIAAAAWTPDGARIATASRDGTARLWTAAGAPLTVLRGHEGPVTCLAFADEGRTLLTGGDDGTVRAWDGRGAVADADSVRGAHMARVTAITVSPDGRRYVTASWDGTARVATLDGLTDVVYAPRAGWMDAAVWSPDGARIAVATRGGTGRVFASDPCEVGVVRCGGETPPEIEFAEDVLCVRADGRVSCFAKRPRVVVLRSDAPIRIVQGERSFEGWNRLRSIDSFESVPSDGVEAADPADLRPDPLADESSRLRAACSPEGVATITFDTGETRAFAVGPSRVASIALSRDGELLATSHADGAVRIWAATSAALLEVANRRAIRPLTAEEQARYANLLGE